MSGIVYKGLISLLSVALCFSVSTWLGARKELQTVTVANKFLRKTLGKMTVAIAEKDREIDRLGQLDCPAGKESKISAGPGVHF
jgi:hypothetical protein